MHFDLNTVSAVAPHIFITNWNSSNDPDILKKYNIKGVLTVEKTPKPKSIVDYMGKNGIKFMQIKLDDTQDEPIIDYLDTGADFINEFVSREQNVLVHCFAGISRSASIVLYYLAKKLVAQGMNPYDAYMLVYSHVHKIRPVQPNSGFVAQILQKLQDKNNLKAQNNMTMDQTKCDTFLDTTGKPGNVICLSSGDFDANGNLVNFKDVSGLIMFYTDSCGWCKKTKPDFASFSNAIKNTPFRAFAVNAAKNKDLLERIKPEVWGYQVRGFPTIVGYHKGQYYSDYQDDAPSEFRTAKSFTDFAKGLGTGKIEWQ